MADQFGNLSPEEYQQQQEINRQQKMAQMLLSQTQQPQGQMVGNRFVAPSFFQNILPLVNMYQGQRLAEQADTKAASLAEAIRGRNATELQNILNKQFGSADYKPAVTPEIKRDDMGNIMPNIENQVGVAPNKQEAFMAASQARGPQAQALFQTLLANKLSPKVHTVAQGGALIQENEQGGITPLYQNPKERVAAGVNLAAAERLGFPTNPDLWTPQQRQLIDQEVHRKIKAGAPVTTNINTVMGKSLADVGPILKESMIGAQGAIQSNDNIDRIIKAASDKGFYGPGANIQMFGAQLADKSGLGGKDTQAKIKNTRDSIQGLAQLVLQGRKQMRGEGSIAQSESLLAEKAISGEVDKLTAAEIIQIAKAAQRVNNYTISSHEQKIKYARSNPETAPAAPYYEVPYYNNSTVQYLGPAKP
jgi:hypothetical protein